MFGLKKPNKKVNKITNPTLRVVQADTFRLSKLDLLIYCEYRCINYSRVYNYYCMLKSSLITAFVVFCAFLLIPKPAFAYLDPGSGSYLIQIIIASVAGGGVLVKTQWRNIKKIFTKKGKSKETKSDEK
jgi:hypothetical protein